ncbi:unnamed protein product [Schistocephalus solidus]|uniref:MAM domain-containing protein n=1 Tax=Schistocephalus solidus TaxID=70667 RepID=A0A183TPC6_SCHSO|nr:unnamed protein product [Schistocephalus solidus]
MLTWEQAMLSWSGDWVPMESITITTSYSCESEQITASSSFAFRYRIRQTGCIRDPSADAVLIRSRDPQDVLGIKAICDADRWTDHRVIRKLTEDEKVIDDQPHVRDQRCSGIASVHAGPNASCATTVHDLLFADDFAL